MLLNITYVCMYLLKLVLNGTFPNFPPVFMSIVSSDFYKTSHTNTIKTQQSPFKTYFKQLM